MTPGAGPPGRWLHLDATLRWVILLSAVLYRVALFLELRSIGFFNYVFVDSKATMDVSLKLLDGQFPGPLMKSSLWFIQFQAILLRLGIGLEGLHLIQYLSGVLLVLTILTLGRRVFGSIPAFIGGAFMACYGPLLFQESQLVTASWAALFFTLAILLPLAFAASPSIPVYLLSGLFMGLGVQSQANMIIAAGTFFVGLWFSLQRGKRTTSLAFPIGVLLVLLPLTIHNFRSGEPLPLTALGGINFFIGNGPEAKGFFHLPEGYSLVNKAGELGPSSLIYPEEKLGLPVSYSEASRFWVGTTIRHMTANPIRAISMLGKKTAMLARSWEVPNNFSYYFFRKQLVQLPLPLNFGILVALAIPWFFKTDRPVFRRPLLWALGGYALSVVLFFVADRYRLPLVPLAALLAGAGIMEIRSRWLSGGVRGVRGLLFLSLLVLVLTHIPGWSAPGGELVHGWNYIGSEHIRQGRMDDAAEAFANTLKVDRYNIEALSSLASIHAKHEKFDQAEKLFRLVLEVDNANQEALLRLGMVLRDGSDPEGALEIFNSGMAAFPENAGFYEGAAMVLLESGQIEESAFILGRAEVMGLRNTALILLEDRVRAAHRSGNQ